MGVVSIHKPTYALTQLELEQIWKLYAPHHNISHDEFLDRIRDGLDALTQFRCKETQKLVGSTGIRRCTFTLSSGEKVYTIYSGMSYIEREYRGYHLLAKTLAHYSFDVKRKHPLRRVFVWSDAISYKPYVLTARSTRVFYPSRKYETPADIKEIIDLVGERYYGDMYDAETGTVRKPSKRLKDHVAPITAEDLSDPDIRFFAERNPGYDDGHGLLNVIPITALNLGLSVANAGIRAARR